MRKRLLVRPKGSARALLDALDKRDPQAPRAQTPAGVLVVIAAQLDESVHDTARAVGVAVDLLRRAVAERVDIGPEVVERLRAWVALLWAQRTREVGARAELVAAVWASPVPLVGSLRAPTPLCGQFDTRRHASRKISPKISETR